MLDRDYRDLPLDAALARRPVGGQRVDDEAVVLGERRRLRVQRDCLAGGDVTLDDRLGAVVDDRARNATEVRKRPAVAVPELPPKCANALRWQSQNVARSIEDVKQVNGSRE